MLTSVISKASHFRSKLVHAAVKETVIVNFNVFQIVCLLLFYTMTTVFQLYLGNDMMYEMVKKKPEFPLLPTQAIFNLPHHIGMAWVELAFDDAVSYIQPGNGLQHS